MLRSGRREMATAVDPTIAVAIQSQPSPLRMRTAIAPATESTASAPNHKLHSPTPMDKSQKCLLGAGNIIQITANSSKRANIKNMKAKILFYFASTNSTTKISVALGGIGPTPPAP